MRNVRKTLAAILGSAALMKLSGHEVMRAKFQHWGYSDELMVTVGAGEATAAALLWTGRGRPVARGIVSAVMIGAAWTHLKTPGERLQAIIPLSVLATANVALDL